MDPPGMSSGTPTMEEAEVWHAFFASSSEHQVVLFAHAVAQFLCVGGRQVCIRACELPNVQAGLVLHASTKWAPANASCMYTSPDMDSMHLLQEFVQLGLVLNFGQPGVQLNFLQKLG